MAKPGPRPTPTDILAMRGSTLVKQRAKEPTPPKVSPPCPGWLTDEAKLVWRQLVKILKDLGVLRKTDGNTMARYCVMWVEWQKCMAFVVKYGLSFPMKRIVGKGENQKTEVVGFMPFPELTQRNRLEKDLLRLEQEFGMTPAARTRIEVEVPELPAPVRKRERRA